MNTRKLPLPKILYPIIAILGLAVVLIQAGSVSAAPAIVIFDEFPYLTPYTWGGTTVDMANTDHVYQGNVSMAIDFGGSFAGLSLLSDSSTDISDYEMVRFWANGDGGGQTIQVSIVSSGGSETASSSVALGSDWQLVEIPLSEFGNPTSFGGVKVGEAGNQSSPATVYIDNFEIVDADEVPTATPDPNASPTPTATLPPSTFDGMRVVGRHLYDRCDERVVLRGVNRMVWWLDVKNDITPPYAEIAQTGANAVRIQWLAEDNEDAELYADMIISELDGAIQGAVDHGMIPMVELHDATLQGADFNLLDEMVDFWVSPEIVPILQKHEAYLLLNIANEIGTSVTDEDFRAGYMDAITRIRAAGLRMPIVIDGTDWGKDVDQMQRIGPELIEHDPEHSLIFSVHMWWPAKWGYTPGRVVEEFRQADNADFPLIVGEFGNSWDEPVDGVDDLPWRTILEYAEQYDIGWLAWSWGDHVPGDSYANNPQHWLDMTTDSTFASLHGWGLEAAVTNPYSILNTSVRPQSMITGECGDPGTPVPTATTDPNVTPSATPTAEPTATVTPILPTATATATSLPPTATTAPPTAVPGSCEVDYTVTNQWGSGFQADVTITNNDSSPISGWTLEWTHASGQAVSSGWNVTISQSGNLVTASNPASQWNGTLAPNGGTASFGFQGTHGGTVVIPTDFVLNGVACGGDTPPPTATSVAPTATSVAPTATSAPPTATVVPPTETSVPPTVTSVPPTATPVPPTATSAPPTATTVPPTATPSSGATCSVDYDVVNQWGDGFQTNITIHNDGSSAVAGYTLSWDFVSGEQVTSGWNATFSQSGTSASASNAASQWNGTIQPGGSASFGFTGSHSGTVSVPASFDLNGTTCSVN